MIGSPSTIRPPESQTNAPQRVPSPLFEDSLSLYRSTNECQMQIDGILQNCAAVAPESLGVEARNGDKVKRKPFEHALPDRGISNIREISDQLTNWADPAAAEGIGSYTGDDFFGLIKDLLGDAPWLASQQTQQQNLTIKNIIDEAKKVLRETPSCRNIFAPDVDPIKLLEDFEKGITGNLTFGNLQSPQGFFVRAETNPPARGPSTIKLNHAGQPIKVATSISTVNITLNAALSSVGRERYGLNTLQDRVVTLIHELGHAANFIRNNFVSADPTASAILNDSRTLPSVSINNSDFVWANCFGSLSNIIQQGDI